MGREANIKLYEFVFCLFWGDVGVECVYLDVLYHFYKGGVYWEELKYLCVSYILNKSN